MNNPLQTRSIPSDGFQTQTMTKTFVSNVFSWMGIGLGITALVSYLFGTTPEYLRMLYNPTSGMTTLGWIVMFAPIGFVLAMGLGFQKLSSTVLLALFLVYSFVMGMSLSFIFVVYSMGSLASTFAVTSAMFGFMAILGYTTKTDLTKFGSLMMMGLFGIIIASVVNFFFQSSGMDYIISFLGVLIFTGLTAYDVQKIKRIGSGVEYGSEAANKLAIMGALSLYLDFINLFLFLLRFLGGRRS
ncbi:MAG: hypothetical protein COC01_05805 [Bacteroidetes bacterium]|nr:Bax inhibitor-1/YccA family protein [Bacteroidia bacterium]PCH67436.1 MAG: hypothetical protein COC01_05805 [Bacteroidota bacterium]